MSESLPRYALGRRIVIRGATGSGKTTLSRRLGEALGLNVIEMDAIYWLENWQFRERDDFRAKLREALAAATDGWVCDGNYRSSAGDIVFDAADTLLWLHLPWRTSFGRVFKRTVGRAISRESMWAGNTESWRQSFASRQSILWWSMRHHQAYVRAGRDAVEAFRARGLPAHELSSPREVEALVAEAEAWRTTR